VKRFASLDPERRMYAAIVSALDDGGTMTGDDAVFLSSLDADPGETANVRHKHPELVDELSTSLPLVSTA
jgi:hypothetical protein